MNVLRCPAPAPWPRISAAPTRGCVRRVDERRGRGARLAAGSVSSLGFFKRRHALRRRSSARSSPTTRRTASPAIAPASGRRCCCTTPVSVTRPCSTTMWIGGFGHDRVVPEVRVAVDRPRDPVAQLVVELRHRQHVDLDRGRSRTPSTLATRFSMSSRLYGIVTLPVSVTTPSFTLALTSSKIVNCV